MSLFLQGWTRLTMVWTQWLVKIALQGEYPPTRPQSKVHAPHAPPGRFPRAAARIGSCSDHTGCGIDPGAGRTPVSKTHATPLHLP